MATIRPKSLSEFIGQERQKSLLSLRMKAARMQSTTLPHILIHGPAGFGKTTLANIIASEMEVELLHILCPEVSDASEIPMKILENPGKYVFLDEVHRLRAKLQESLYILLEDFKIDYRGVLLDIPDFCMISATTEVGSLLRPMRDRYPIVLSLGEYSQDNLIDMVKWYASQLNSSISDTAAQVIAVVCKGTPRAVTRILMACNDMRVVEEAEYISEGIVRDTLDLMNINNKGLDEDDRKYLQTLIVSFDGGPAGVDALSLATDINKFTIIETIEPYLMKIGYIQRTPTGRRVTEKGMMELVQVLG